MTVSTEEIVDRLNDGKETLEKVETVFWPNVIKIANQVLENPVAGVLLIVILAVLYNLIRKIKR